MARAKRRSAFNPLSLAFLDVMSCGFGAVVLIFLILDHTSTERAGEADPNHSAEIALLDQDIQEGELELVRVRNALDEVSLEVVSAQGLASRIQTQIDDFLQQLAELEGITQGGDVDDLREEVRRLEEEILRLQTTAIEETGRDARAFAGDGDRQYLTGLFLGGNRILILLDMSASMMDETLVNIIRLRNMNDDSKRGARKWQRAVKSVDWITSQLPVGSQYQIIAFNDQTRAVRAGTEGTWLEVADRDGLNAAIRDVEQLVPSQGTNLERAFESIRELSPPPDNIYLITDGLPTLSNRPSSATLITPEQRLNLFQGAARLLPRNVPVNVILFPLEGDPSAAAAYWLLAQQSRGSFLSPSRDWP